MEAFFISTAIVAVGEIGDKTQLLALVLAARFKRPLPIVLGIFVATLANHALAGLAGEWLRRAIDPEHLRWGLGLSFLAVALWALRADKLDGPEKSAGRDAVFLVTLGAFFLAEMGDKTQIATVMLAAKFSALAAVVAGTTLGMMIANVPAVFLGHVAAARIPFRAVRLAAMSIFALLGISTLAGLELS